MATRMMLPATRDEVRLHPADASMAPPVEDDMDPYRRLVIAIVERAVEDAQGNCASPGHTSVGKLQFQAQRWLADTDAVGELLELAGYDPAPVLARLQGGVLAARGSARSSL